MTTQQSRRPEDDPEATAEAFRGAENSVPLALIDYVVRVAIDADGRDPDGRRPHFDDMPTRSRLEVDVTACRFPPHAAVLGIHDAMRRGVQVKIITNSTLAARAWHDALGRVSW